MFPDCTVFTVLSWVSCSLCKHSLESILYKTAKSNSNHQFGAVQFCVNSSVFSAQILLINTYLRMKPYSNTSCHKSMLFSPGRILPQSCEWPIPEAVLVILVPGKCLRLRHKFTLVSGAAGPYLASFPHFPCVFRHLYRHPFTHYKLPLTLIFYDSISPTLWSQISINSHRET